MSYNIGQLRRNQIKEYDTPIEILSSMAGTFSIIDSSGLTIKNSCINLPSGTLKKDVNYYFIFALTDNNKSFVVTLRGGEKEQPIKFFNRTSPTGIYTMVFTPNDNIYTQIVFKLTERATGSAVVALDKTSNNNILTRIKLYELINIVPKLGDIDSIKKFGLQGPPGLMFSMNGEEIHIGKSGIYEVEDVNINNLSFVLKTNEDGEKDFFIMDYMYNKEVK